MKPWREVSVPHRDVLEGTFQLSEFAADISAVKAGNATPEYQNAAAFFDRTFITEGMALLLTAVAQRLSGKDGEPVMQLQTAFGGGKTHTMLSVYHMATRKCNLSELPGIPALVDRSGLIDIPKARIAVLDGNALSAGQPQKRGALAVNTLWGELAWQLGGTEAYKMVAEADASGTSPGKEYLRQLLEQYAPCIVLIDELVAYIRQFTETEKFSGGTYDSNLSFVQALTEAVKLVPRSMTLATLPESEVEAGGQLGIKALRALEKTFARVQSIWKPVATEEAFEIVRRRLFEPIQDGKARETVCRAFADVYKSEGANLPSETQERHYYERLLQAYPIHPEVFDRLYDDWTTIDGFQRTRGVLKLMAKVINRLWKDDNKDLLIMPGSLPLHDVPCRNELTCYLSAGWDAVIERDIDGERSETTALENREPRFGQICAARGVTRTIFLGSAPSSISPKVTTRGIDRARILLGCLQPAQASSVYTDALNRLADRLHYLNASGDKSQDATRFWFDTRANLRREMEDRKRRFDDLTEVRSCISGAIQKIVGNATFFDGVHIFTPHADVPDDAALRLIVLPVGKWFTREDQRQSTDAVLEYIANHGAKPRQRGNRLIFLAADHSTLSRLDDAARTALAWRSIVEDVKTTRLNIDLLQKSQAEKECNTSEEVLLRASRECYKWLLCPTQENPTLHDPTVDAFPLTTSSGNVGGEIERICTENELVISAWAPIHLRAKLHEFYWTDGKTSANATQFYNDTLRYLYLPRLQNRKIFEQTIFAGTGSRDFFGIAYGETEDTLDGFSFGGGNVVFDDSLILIEPESAQRYEVANRSGDAQEILPPDSEEASPEEQNVNTPSQSSEADKPKAYYGKAEVPIQTAKVHLAKVADEIVSVLSSDPKVKVQVSVEISAEFPEGATDDIKRAISENARELELNISEWE